MALWEAHLLSCTHAPFMYVFPCMRQWYRYYFCLHNICGTFEVFKVQGVAEERRVMGRSQLQQVLRVSVVGVFMHLFVWSFLLLFFNSRRVEYPLQRENTQIYQVSHLSFSLPFLLLCSHAPFSSFLYGWFYSLIETAFFPFLQLVGYKEEELTGLK